MGLFVLDMVCAFLISAADLIYPMVSRNLINNIIHNRQIAVIFKFGIILLVLYFVRMILEYIVGYYGHVLGVKIEYDMRKDLFSHIESLSFSYFDNTKTGHIMSRVVNDLFDIAEVAHHGPENLFISTIKIIGAFVLLLFINVKLTLIVFTIIPFMFYFMVVYNNKLEAVFRKFRESVADINSKVEDTISGIRVVKSFTNEDSRRKSLIAAMCYTGN
jgi:ATP-binding cassette subfamily B protein